MITFDVVNQPFALVTNPKSGVTTTHNVLANLLHEEFTRYDEGDLPSGVEGKQTAFIFRNPYERAVSMFFRFNRVLWTDPSGARKAVTQEILRRYGQDEGFTFLDFLSFLRETPNEERDIHYRSQGIPGKYDHLVRTNRYREDAVSFFDRIGYAKGVAVLSRSASMSVVANSVKKNEDAGASWPSMRSLRTFDFEVFEKTGYPPYGVFLDSETRRLIDDLFGEEVQLYNSVAWS